MKLFRYILAPELLLAAMLCVSACDTHNDDMRDGTGTVTVNISNPVEIQTRHAENEGSDASDGGIMKTLGVWLITDGAANGDSNYTILQRYLGKPDAATATVTFDDVARGNYFLIVVANYDQTTMSVADYGPGKSVSTDFTSSLVKISPSSTSSALSDGQSPTFDDTFGMPSSFEKTFSVAAGENVIDASLRRCVGRLTFNVRNNLDDYELFIHSIGLSKYNRSQGNVLESESLSGSYVDFPDLPDMDQDGDGEKDGLVQVGPRAYKNVYDIYLFETNPADSINFDMLAALYPKDTDKSTVKVSSRTQSPYEIQGVTYTFTNSKQYMICSGMSSTYYLGDTGSAGSGTLVATSLTSDDDIKALSNITAYFWKFSSSTGNSTTIQNVATGNYLTLSSDGISLSKDPSNVYSESASNIYVRFYIKVQNGRRDKSYYLSFDGSSISSSDKGNKRNWYVRPVKVGTGGTVYEFDNPELNVVSIPPNDRPIKYIDAFGASQLLTKIGRNEHVTVNINVFYNRELGEFTFEVLDWDDGGSHETTFD